MSDPAASPARPSRPSRPTRADYVDWRAATTRWSDDDVYGHLNNARYFDLIDTAVNAHLAEATGTDIRVLPQIGVVAEVSCRYFAEMGYPRPIELGLVVERLGSSSVIYRVGLFQGGDGSADEQACAEGRFVHVYVDNTDPGGGRPVTPVPDLIRSVLEPLVR
ncbi:acyl-CoA thioesterase [Nocardioides sp.]|jgi:acyl-CoA thioester hydrolase|uniref:acyl-CoA thioesterase n=1 Tax=Nocardioides sp. TaxID=35761 RepID=UPI001DF5F2E8|nr:acyl-CoA thioesterase [Nocardioides sp.]MBU1801248.1 acyl-CoA thioesterase [Actinomycetota bacterium]